MLDDSRHFIDGTAHLDTDQRCLYDAGDPAHPAAPPARLPLSRTKYVWYCGHRDHISCVPKTEELFQEHFYWLKAPGVEEEEDCGCHPTRRLL